MSSAPLNPLTPETDYKAPIDLRLDRQLWDFVFLSVGSRLRTLEAKRTELEAVIDELRGRALEVISESVSAEILAQRARLAVFDEQLQTLKDAYDEYMQGGVYTDGIRMREVVSGLAGSNVQDVLESIGSSLASLQASITTAQGTLDSRRNITVASLFLGGS